MTLAHVDAHDGTSTVGGDVVATRLERFRQALSAAGLDGAVVGRPASVTYLTGYAASRENASFAVVGPERAILVAPGGSDVLGRSLADGVAAIGYPPLGGSLHAIPDPDNASAAALAQAVGEAGLEGKRTGLEEAHVSYLHAAAVAARAKIAPLGDQLEAMRRIKDEQELALIRAAVAANDAGFAAAARAIAPGVSEFDVQHAVAAAIQEFAGVPIHVIAGTNAFVSGPRTLLAAAPATPRRLERGDLMIVDVNPFIRSYKGDTTRTFCVGEPTPEQQRLHDAVVRGLEAGERVAKPGVPGRDVYHALFRPIEEAGFVGGIRFHGGHAIGLEHVERPSIIPAEDMPLEAGMVITLEPGAYISGIGGARVEDQYLVTDGGLEVLSHYPRDLVRCAAD